MSKQAFTPGPWELKEDTWGVGRPQMYDRVLTSPANSLGLAVIYCDYAEDLANARLIAAAPELLKALKESLTLLESAEKVLTDKYDHFSTRQADSSYFGKTMISIEEAIAKAEGQ